MDATKQTLIAEIEKRVSDKILEQTNADLLIKLINNADTLDEAINIAALGTTYKRTGLHFDKRLEKMSDTIKYFKKDEKLSFHTDDSKPTHKLIIGDNYEALQNLLIQYRGKIDVIYIDPPYGKDSMGEFAATNYNNAITRDNLLSMLYPRLVLAKQLLSDEGVIFCSIDDKNQAYVKCLFDEVMGEMNFIACISCLSNPGGDKKDYIETTTQYILTYCKDKKHLSDLGSYESQDVSEYNLIDQKGRYRKGGQLEKWGNDDTTHTHPNLAYSIYYNPKSNNVVCLYDYNREEINADRTLNVCYDSPSEELTNQGYYCIRPRVTNTGENGRWRLEESTFKERFSKDEFIFEKQGEGYKIYEKSRFSGTRFVKAKNFIPSDKAQQRTIELRDIFGNKPFGYPKPIPLIILLIKWINKSDAIILDFFAGSGTTGHAVLDLNRSEAKEGDLLNEEKSKGNRTFILCQLNEKTDTTPNGIAYDVTSKRLKRIMTGECYDGTKDFEWIKKNKPYGGNLDVYEIESVPNFEWTEGKTPFDVIDETLYGKEKFANIKEKIEWVCGNFDKTQKYLEQQKTEE